MGTSSTRSGRKDNSSSKLWKIAKTNISRYLRGDGSFANAVMSTIKAYGGPEQYLNGFRIKKTKAYTALFGVVLGAATTTLRQSLVNAGYNPPENLSAKDLLIGYVNEIYPDTNTPEDTLIREELLESALFFSSLFDNELKLDLEYNVFVGIITEYTIDEVAKEYQESLELESPYSVETDNQNLTNSIKKSTNEDIKKLLRDFMKEYKDDPLNQEKIRSFLQLKLDLFYESGGKA